MTNRVGFPVGFGVGFGVGQASQEFAAAAPAGYELSFATLGLAGNGFVLDGLESRVATTSTDPLNNLCVTANSDPVGWFEDLSGNNDPCIQTTSANKPVYITNNGVKGFRAGEISAVRRVLENTCNLPAAFVLYVVQYVDTGVSYAPVATFRQTPPYFQTYRDNNSRSLSVYDSGAAGTTGTVLGDALIIKLVRTGTGANQATATVIGTTTASTNMTLPSTYTNEVAEFGGWTDFGSEATKNFALFYYEGTMTAGQHAAVLSRFETIRSTLV